MNLTRDNLAARIMIVDDEPLNIKVARKYLSIAGYDDFVTTTDATRAMEMIRTERPDVILLDIMMPRVSGLEILQAVRADASLAHLPVLILTAATDAQTKQSALELGATDFLAKPVDPADLVPRVRNTLLVKAHLDHLAGYSQELEREVRKRTSELEASRLEVIHCLARAAEYRDDDTGRHVMRVGRYAGILARELGFQNDRAAMLEIVAQLHDVGKIGIPDAILLKPGRLDPDEFRVMQKHCEYGRQIIIPESGEDRSDAPLLSLAARIAFTHHEKWDGTGYPSRLAQTDIPMEGRITAVADVFDALCSRRPYKPAFSLEQCLGILREGRATHFDPIVIDAFFRRIGDIVSVQSQLADAA